MTLAPLSNTDTLMTALEAIATSAGDVILEFYAAGDGVEVRHKEDSSPVTAADEAAEHHILEALSKLTPDIPIVSEEAFSVGTIPDISGGRFWLVDPLDGTREFLSRNGEFTVNIALIEGGLPVAGVVQAPALDKIWSGSIFDGQAPRARYSEQGQPAVAVSVRQKPASGVLAAASRRHGDTDLLDQFLADNGVEDLLSAGSSLKFCLVATGQADFYPRFGRTMEWDTAAGHAVLRAAGGAVRTHVGGVHTEPGIPLTYGKPGFENPYFIASGKN